MERTEHPAVTRVLNDLAEHGLRPEVVWFSDAVTTAQSAADALGVQVGQIANSLVFTFDAEPVLLLTSGAHRVDTQWLGQQLGTTIGRASKEVVREATGQVIGGVAPVGHPQQVVTYVDPALAEYQEVWAAAGHPKTVFPTTYDQLLTVTGGTPQPVRPPH
ncbi:YbaK/EbsC family protein [Nesterenkonia sphaerica]|uniref:YbaK/EbsC family protein n=1 Tax=Nesterenkonia sphaerica TaxID=1804988 RepID=A0A5R9A423_9MICC|nr:YbaK/EbsC family protein [Nesterenkonia sphaerica]TLP73290.1 YbaK/EbsC family protein [Nesterenkonia sphaerica]